MPLVQLCYASLHKQLLIASLQSPLELHRREATATSLLADSVPHQLVAKWGPRTVSSALSCYHVGPGRGFVMAVAVAVVFCCTDLSPGIARPWKGARRIQ